jgi:hypothetical protein
VGLKWTRERFKMSKYISEDKLELELFAIEEAKRILEFAEKHYQQIESVDIEEFILKNHIGVVQEVEHGHWYDKGSLSCRCSECKGKSAAESLYCPNCGAKMDEEEDLK